MVTIEQTRCQCDHCEELGQGVILTTVNGDQISSIQLCNDCAAYFGKEMNPSLITTIESQKEEITELLRVNSVKSQQLFEKDLEISLLEKDIQDWHLHYNGRIHTLINSHESLEAITELAVNMLNLARDRFSGFGRNWDCETDEHKPNTCRRCESKRFRELIDATLNEIEDIQNDK